MVNFLTDDWSFDWCLFILMDINQGPYKDSTVGRLKCFQKKLVNGVVTSPLPGGCQGDECKWHCIRTLLVLWLHAMWTPFLTTVMWNTNIRVSETTTQLPIQSFNYCWKPTEHTNPNYTSMLLICFFPLLDTFSFLNWCDLLQQDILNLPFLGVGILPLHIEIVKKKCEQTYKLKFINILNMIRQIRPAP